MATAYTPALEVAPYTRIVKVRELPLRGRALVQIGDRVTGTDPVLTADLPGELDIVRVADQLGVDPMEIGAALRVRKGDSVRQGEILCERHTLFGLFTSRVTSPTEGTIEFYTEANGHVGIRRPPTPLSVNAYVSGTIAAVDEGRSVTIETDGALVQGIFGVGGERLGKILALPVAPDALVEPRDLQGTSLAGRILVGGARFTLEAIRHGKADGAVAIVTGSIDSDTLAAYVGREIGVSVTGDEAIALTAIITEGFGHLPIAPRTLALLQKLDGADASLSGATQVRAGAVRPEIIVPLEQPPSVAAASGPLVLETGARVRCVRYPHFGKLGTTIDLPPQPQPIATGAHVRVLTVHLDRGDVVTIPRANVELIGG